MQNNPTEILNNYAYATQLDPDWYKGWHIWALANFEVITHLELQKTVLAADAFNIYIKPAVQGQHFSTVLQSIISASLTRPYSSFLPLDRLVSWRLAAGYAATADSLVHLRLRARS